MRLPVSGTVAACALLAAGAGHGAPAAPEVSPFRSECRWIWDGGEAAPVDAYRCFRKTFTVTGQRPGKALLRITADREYRLFVNGSYVARGPAPNPPAHASFDQIDVAAHLARGKNVIAVLVYHLGVPSFQTMQGRAGLLAQLDMGDKSVVTDGSWRWRAAWWEPTGIRFTAMREFNEHLDARREPVGWTTTRFDDRTWKRAVAIGPARGTAPWTAIEPRDIPMPNHHDLFAQGLLFVGGTSKTVPPHNKVAPAFAKEPQQPFAAGDARNLDALTARGGAEAATIDGREQGVVLGLDWGREVSGFPEFTVESDADGAVLDIGYGEGLEPDGHVTVFRQGNHAVDRITLRRGLQTLRIFHHRAFRYMVLAARGGRIRLHPPKLVESTYPVAHRGAFACSDPRLTKAWEIGRRTMRLCMDQSFMDCPHRERGQYIGDALAEGPVALYAFGDTALMRRFLRQAKFCQPADGLLEPAYPTDWTSWHGDRGPNRIPGYGALWVVLLNDHYQITGDLPLVQELAPTLERQVAYFDTFRGTDGLLTKAPEWNFMDWVDLSEHSTLACLNLQYLLALRANAALKGVLKRELPAAQRPEAVATAFEKAHWDEARGLFRDAPGVYSVHTNALALLALDLDAARAKRIADGILGDKTLVQVGSPYFEGFVLRGLMRWGHHDAVLKRVHEKWGPQIDAGATTFWESYAGQWSLCHAWSCEPTALLSRDILGVRYDAATRTVTVAPHPSGLAWAQGIAPLPCGDVAVRWDTAKGAFTATVSSPADTTLALDIPAADGMTLIVDGMPHEAKPSAGRVRVRLSGGAHVIAVSPR